MAHSDKGFAAATTAVPALATATDPMAGMERDIRDAPVASVRAAFTGDQAKAAEASNPAADAIAKAQNHEQHIEVLFPSKAAGYRSCPNGHDRSLGRCVIALAVPHGSAVRLAPPTSPATTAYTSPVAWSQPNSPLFPGQMFRFNQLRFQFCCLKPELDEGSCMLRKCYIVVPQISPDCSLQREISIHDAG